MLSRNGYVVAQRICCLATNVVSQRMLCRNGYPDNFLDRCIQQFLNRKYVVTQQRGAPAEPSPSPKYISLQLPYLGAIPNNIRQDLSSFIKTQGCSERKATLFPKHSKASKLVLC